MNLLKDFVKKKKKCFKESAVFLCMCLALNFFFFTAALCQWMQSPGLFLQTPMSRLSVCQSLYIYVVLVLHSLIASQSPGSHVSVFLSV